MSVCKMTLLIFQTLITIYKGALCLILPYLFDDIEKIAFNLIQSNLVTFYYMYWA